MKNMQLQNYTLLVECDGENRDAQVTIEATGDGLNVFLTATESRPCFVRLCWTFKSDGDLQVLGDAFERSYGDLGFRRLRDNARWMPWYFLATDGTAHWCFGVKTQPNAFVSFYYHESGLTATLDCRCGGCGVRLCGRKLLLASFVLRQYEDCTAFDALHRFCKTLCDRPLLPQTMIYGGNNWYYAYGESDYETILSDAKLQSSLADGIENRPFMVVDDGWQQNRCVGPWLPNEKFPDMRRLADEVRSVGVRPGIWIRPLETKDPNVPERWKIERGGARTYLDPTVPGVQDLLRSDLRRIRGWGYELLKYDFTTYDLFGDWGKDLGETITNETGWHFFDQSKTGAEIVKDLYRLILEESGDMLLIGCNTVSHLCAGLVHINRTGDDTSGKDWARTRKMGVNTLAFRLAQNGAFYLVDADCVGILGDHIPWDKNRQWLDLLSKSGTALFVSCNRADEQQTRDLRTAFLAAQQPHTIVPLDWTDTKLPQRWLIDGEPVTYVW